MRRNPPATCWATRNSAIPASGARSRRPSAWPTGTTSAWPGTSGAMSRNAQTQSSRQITLAGAAPATMAQKTQEDTARAAYARPVRASTRVHVGQDTARSRARAWRREPQAKSWGTSIAASSRGSPRERPPVLGHRRCDGESAFPCGAFCARRRPLPPSHPVLRRPRTHRHRRRLFGRCHLDAAPRLAARSLPPHARAAEQPRRVSRRRRLRRGRRDRGSAQARSLPAGREAAAMRSARGLHARQRGRLRRPGPKGGRLGSRMRTGRAPARLGHRPAAAATAPRAATSLGTGAAGPARSADDLAPVEDEARRCHRLRRG